MVRGLKADTYTGIGFDVHAFLADLEDVTDADARETAVDIEDGELFEGSNAEIVGALGFLWGKDHEGVFHAYEVG